MKPFSLLAFTFIFLISCKGDNQTENAVEEPEIDGFTEEVASEELTQEIEEDENADEKNQDSLASIMNDLEQRRLDMWGQLEDARESLYKFEYNSNGDYDSETSSWYFTEDFEPLFHYRDFAAEGGYIETYFYVLTNGQVSFAYFYLDEMGIPTKYYHYINTYEGGEELVGFRNRYVDEVVGNIEEYFVPKMMEYDLNYFDWLKEFKGNDYIKDSSVFINDQRTLEESIYGGSDLMGSSVSIDSALFYHLYE
jgi:hypothetical protein